MTLRIFLDTSILDRPKKPTDIFNDGLQSITDFLKEHKITDAKILLPRVVLEELIAHSKDSLQKRVEKYKETSSELFEDGMINKPGPIKLIDPVELRDHAISSAKTVGVEILDYSSLPCAQRQRGAGTAW